MPAGLPQAEESMVAVGRHRDGILVALQGRRCIGEGMRAIVVCGGLQGPALRVSGPGEEDRRGDGQRGVGERTQQGSLLREAGHEGLNLDRFGDPAEAIVDQFRIRGGAEVSSEFGVVPKEHDPQGQVRKAITRKKVILAGQSDGVRV